MPPRSRGGRHRCRGRVRRWRDGGGRGMWAATTVARAVVNGVVVVSANAAGVRHPPPRLLHSGGVDGDDRIDGDREGGRGAPAAAAVAAVAPPLEWCTAANGGSRVVDHRGTVLAAAGAGPSAAAVAEVDLPALRAARADGGRGGDGRGGGWLPRLCPGVYAAEYQRAADAGLGGGVAGGGAGGVPARAVAAAVSAAIRGLEAGGVFHPE